METTEPGAEVPSPIDTREQESSIDPIEPEAQPALSQSNDVQPQVTERKRIEEQLSALKRREGELRRALAIAEHPELADAVRLLEGCTYAVTRVEAKMAQGLSKSEEKRRDTAEKKLVLAQQKRAEIEAQIAEYEAELRALGEERTRAFEVERREALMQLIATLGTHDEAFASAGLDPSSLVPELPRLMPEVQTLAEELVRTRDSQRSRN